MKKQCKFCGYEWDTYVDGDPCILAGYEICESCHDDLYGEFNKAEYDAERSTTHEVSNSSELDKWHFVHKDGVALGLKGDVSWAIRGKINVMWIDLETEDSIVIEYKAIGAGQIGGE